MESLSRKLFTVRVAAELAVVFVGVSAAFVVENFREDRRERRHAVQLAAALYGDLTAFAEASSAYIDGVRAGLAAFEQARAEGGIPVPFTLRVHGAEGPPIDVWEAAMQSGAGEVLDPRLVLELAAFYHELSGASSKYVRYAGFTEREVWPLTFGDTAAFYDRGTGALKPVFRAHLELLDEIVADLVAVQARAGVLAERVAALYPAAVGPSAGSRP